MSSRTSTSEEREEDGWRTFRLTLGYLGTAYAGWERQAAGFTAGRPTVQAVVEDALAGVLARPIRLRAAGRTDAGVHADAQVAAFQAETTIPARGILALLRQRLPADIWAVDLVEAPAGFDPRRSALRRWYRYALWRGEVPPAEWRGRCLTWPDPLDVAAMRAAARYLLGTASRGALAGRQGQDRPTAGRLRRTIFVADWLTPGGPLLLFEICGDAFVRQMVRTIVGSLLRVGSGQWTVAQFREALESDDRRAAGPTAPAIGLTLRTIEYPSTFTLPIQD